MGQAPGWGQRSRIRTQAFSLCQSLGLNLLIVHVSVHGSFIPNLIYDNSVILLLVSGVWVGPGVND